ncbi:hypothetical protein NPIL_38531 [Nephila pilipes]|uniref:Uncharacterized protein n=1 Tax=Nephila pilipes TaxID=299642 RepID=A0A8X6TWD1_NEPPI|nr:hypothetical protein NPIL_38531 [Nephila pilipes]
MASQSSKRHPLAAAAKPRRCYAPSAQLAVKPAQPRQEKRQRKTAAVPLKAASRHCKATAVLRSRTTTAQPLPLTPSYTWHNTCHAFGCNAAFRRLRRLCRVEPLAAYR